MKNIILFILLSTPFFSSFAQIKIGAKLGYGSEIESLGLGAKGTYDINDQFRGSAELMYFFGNTTETSVPATLFSQALDSKTTVSQFNINTDVHYLFSVNNSAFLPYALGGLNFSVVRTSMETGQLNSDSSDTFIGLNLGAGGTYQLNDQLDLFSELKYIINDFDQLVFSVGILYYL